MTPDRLLALRDRILARRGFQRWAARFPLTRPIARRNTRILFDMCAGFIHAQTLSACLQLHLFDLLAAAPRSRAALAHACAIPASAMDRLLDAAVALDLLQPRSGNRIGLGSLGAALRGNPALADMISHHALIYDDLRDPLALLRAPPGTSRLATYWAYATTPDPTAVPGAETHAYTALMAATQPMIADEILAAYDFRRHTTLLDVGGGDGSFLAAVANRAPGLNLMLFDLPAVAAAARKRLAQSGHDTAVCTGGDLRRDPFPRGADIISFVRVLHDHNDADVGHMLAAARAALPPNGRILIAEPMADDPSAAAYFSLYLLAMGSGQPRHARRLESLLRDAGFVRPRRHATPTPLLVSVLTASCK